MEFEEPLTETMSGVNCKYYDVNDFTSLDFIGSNNFSLFHLNIASLSKHFDELSVLLGQLGHGFSIIGITETGFQNNIPAINCDLPGYNYVHTPTKSEKGGALLYISDCLQYTERVDLDKITYKDRELESKFIEIIQANDKNIIVGCIYRHPLMSVSEFNIDYLTPLLNKASSENKVLLLTGDFNVDLLKADINKDFEDYLDILYSYHLLPHIIFPTRVTDITSTLIDNIFFNSVKFNTVSGNLTSSISDHFPQFLLLKSDPANSALPPEKTSSPVHDWSKFCLNNFLDDLGKINWDDSLHTDDPSLSFDIFHNTVSDLLDKHAPLKKLSKSKKRKKSNPWITKGILTSIDKRDNLRKCYLKEKDPFLKSLLLESFKKYRNRIVSLCKMSKSNFFHKFFSNNQKNIGKVWEGVKSLISLRSSASPPPTCINVGNTLITDTAVVSNSFNKYFTSIAESIRKNIPYASKHFSSFLKNPVENSIFLSPTDSTEVMDCISSLNTSKSTGPYSIPSKILSSIKAEISVPLSKIINLSFTTGIFPTNLKTAKVIPIHKKGSKLELSNYRPISLLSNIDKIFEKLLYKRVYGFLDANKVLYKQQFGFRKSYSTAQALLNISQKIMDALDKGNYACGVFIDLQKAFDTVDHEILLKKLFHYGIRGTALSLFRSYLTNRQQFVSIGGVNSAGRVIRHGVPQGSVLGPLLFLLYINDLFSAILYSDVHHFADDTNLINISGSLKQLAKQMNLDLKFLSQWLNANKISLNASKTEYIIFKHARKPMNYDFRLSIHGKRLFPSTSIKYLGVLLDADLSWKSQINNVAAKLKRANGALSKLRHFVPPQVLLLAYYAIFHSHLQYCCQIWGQPNSTFINRICVLQNCAMRIMAFKAPRDSASDLYANFGVLKFSDMVHLQNILFLEKLSHNKMPDAIQNTFVVDFTHTQPTRANDVGLINLPLVETTSFGKHSIRYNALLSWNLVQSLLPIKLFDFEDIKTDLKKCLIASY